MTDGSSKGLTWGTLLAGVVSALALAAIGCVKPMSERDGAGLGLSGSGGQGAPEAGSAPSSFVSRETLQRPGDNRLPTSSH